MNEVLTMTRSERRTIRFVRQFRDDESGSILILGLFLISVMLVMGGMSVDFMRFEAKRSVVQGCVDNAVLATADLDKEGTEEELKATVEDWFQAGDCIGSLDGAPEIEPGLNYRSVKASADLSLNTFFLHMIGMDTMTAGAISAANEGIGNIEVSMVLDISGSMQEVIVDQWGNPIDFDTSTSKTVSRTRMDALRLAATDFLETLLDPQYGDRVSVSLVPYSGHVNIGPDLFEAINTDHRHDFSYCIDFPDSELSQPSFDVSLTYPQTEHFQFNSAYTRSSDGSFVPLIDQPLCPRYSYEKVIPVSNDVDELKAAVSKLQPRSATAIYMGLKWGMALLDPSMKPVLDTLPSDVIDAGMRGRPSEYSTTTGSGSTIKFLVLMTDGQNDPHPRLVPELADEPSEIAMWNRHHWWSYRNSHLCNLSNTCYNTSGVFMTENDVDSLNSLMQTLCSNARAKGIVIYGVAMAATETGQKQLSDCVDSPARYFETDGGSLVEIFNMIADQITELRLTQ